MMVGYTVLGEVIVPASVAATEPAKETGVEEPVQEVPRASSKPPLLTVVKKELPPSAATAFAELLEAAPKGRVEIVDLYHAYSARTGEKLKPEEFAEMVRLFCKGEGIKTAGHYLLGVRLVTRPGATASIPSTTLGKRGALSSDAGP